MGRLRDALLNDASPVDLRQECAVVLGVACVPEPNVVSSLFAAQVPKALASIFKEDVPGQLLLPTLSAMRNICLAIIAIIGQPMHGLRALGRAVVIPGTHQAHNYLTQLESSENIQTLKPIMGAMTGMSQVRLCALILWEMLTGHPPVLDSRNITTPPPCYTFSRECRPHDLRASRALRDDYRLHP